MWCLCCLFFGWTSNILISHLLWFFRCSNYHAELRSLRMVNPWRSICRYSSISLTMRIEKSAIFTLNLVRLVNYFLVLSEAEWDVLYKTDEQNYVDGFEMIVWLFQISPLTAADLESNKVICTEFAVIRHIRERWRLKEAFPPNSDHFWRKPRSTTMIPSIHFSRFRILNAKTGVVVGSSTPSTGRRNSSRVSDFNLSANLLQELANLRLISG